MATTNGTLPYWNVNVPEPERTVACPDFLVDIHDRDRSIISTPDSEYQIQSWDEVRRFVTKAQLEHFRRVPSDLRRYKAFTFQLAKQYGSVTNFMLRKRLGWEEPVRPRGRPFEFSDDYKILYNDWPYGIDPRIVHLVVWTKFALDEEDPDTGALTPDAKTALDNFMNETFFSHIPESQVLYFKNWARLKSIHSVEHFHIMLFNPDPDFVRRVTNGDVPQCDKPTLSL